MRTIKEIEADGKKINALFDTGAVHSYITQKYAPKDKKKITPITSFEVGIGGEYKKVSEVCNFIGKIEGLEFDAKAYILDKIGPIDGKEVDAIIGATTMEEWEIKIDMKTGELDLSGLKRRVFIEW